MVVPLVECIFEKMNFRYTYGKFVTGRVEANLCLKNRNGRQNCVTELRNVSGM